MDKLRELTLAKKVGKAIAERRHAQGITQEVMAEQLGVGLEAVSRMERGQIMPSVARLVEVAELLRCPVQNFLIAGSDRAMDHGIQLATKLGKLKPADRDMVLEILERLMMRLK
jgi:transcriptional regulator with XRE-family HTH domain